MQEADSFLAFCRLPWVLKVCFGSVADIGCVFRVVRLVPIADLCERRPELALGLKDARGHFARR